MTDIHPCHRKSHKSSCTFCDKLHTVSIKLQLHFVIRMANQDHSDNEDCAVLTIRVESYIIHGICVYFHISLLVHNLTTGCNMETKREESDAEEEVIRPRRGRPPKKGRKVEPVPKETKAAAQERADTGVAVVFPWRAQSIGHYDIPIRLNSGLSSIENAGDGCFAGQHIPGPNFMIGFYGGPRARLLSDDEFQQMNSIEQQKCLPIKFFGTLVWVWPETRPKNTRHPTYLINHRASIAPANRRRLTNVMITQEGCVVSARDIQAGEELFADYGLQYWVDYLIMHEKPETQHVTEQQFKEAYQTGFPVKPADLVWDAVDRFYCNAEPGLDLKQGHSCSKEEFDFVMDYIVDTYIVGLKARTMIDRQGVLGMARYAWIKWSTSVSKLEEKMHIKLSGRAKHELNAMALHIDKVSRELGVVELVDTSDGDEPVDRPRSIFDRADESELEVDFDEEQQQQPQEQPEVKLTPAVKQDSLQKFRADRQRALVREAFREEVINYFFVLKGFKPKSQLNTWMIRYRWHGIPDQTFKHVFKVGHDTIRYDRDLLYARMTDNWTENVQRPDAEEVTSLRSVTSNVLVEMLAQGRGRSAGTGTDAIPLFPFQLSTDPASGGVPAEPRVSSSSDGQDREATANGQQADVTEHVAEVLHTSVRLEVRHPMPVVSFIDDPRRDESFAQFYEAYRNPENRQELDRQAAAYAGPEPSPEEEEEVEVGIGAEAEEEKPEVVAGAGREPDPESVAAAAAAQAEAKKEEDSRAGVPLNGSEASKLVHPFAQPRAYATAGVLDVLGPPQPKPANEQEFVRTALSDWRFKLYEPSV